MGQVGSMRAYGRHRGVTHHAVQKAVEAGRITLTPDRRVDFEQADAEWEANSLNGNGRARRAQHHGPVSSGATRGTVAEANRRFLEARARLAELEYQLKVRELMPVAEVEKAAFECARRARDLLLSMANRLAPVVAGLNTTDECCRAIEKEVHDALDELAGRRNGKPSRRVRRARSTGKTTEVQGARP